MKDVTQTEIRFPVEFYCDDVARDDVAADDVARDDVAADDMEYDDMS